MATVTITVISYICCCNHTMQHHMQYMLNSKTADCKITKLHQNQILNKFKVLHNYKQTANVYIPNLY